VAELAAGGELQRQHGARRRRTEADHAVAVQRVRSLRDAVPREVGGRRAGRLLQRGQPARDQVAVGEVADAERAIDPFPHQVHVAVALAEKEFDAGVFGEEARQVRHHEVAGQRAVDVHVERAAGLGAAEGAFGVLQVGDQPQATLVVRLAVRGGAHVARGALEELRPQPGLQLLHRVRDR
jgi:hypothetical protein